LLFVGTGQEATADIFDGSVATPAEEMTCVGISYSIG
jgi:hypothetical protein